MNKRIFSACPGGIALLFGALGLILRWLLYRTAMDGPYLLKTGHPLETALWLVTGAALLLFLFLARRAGGSCGYGDTFAPSPQAFAGHLLFAAGVGLIMLTREPQLPGALGLLWRVLGCLVVPCLAAAGVCRLRGKQPEFFLHLVPCLFLIIHILSHYRSWNSAPQLVGCVFAAFASMALMFFCFYQTAFDVDLGKRRMLTFFGLTAVYLCLCECARTEDLWLYLGGALYAAADLPLPAPEAEKPC